MALSVNEFALLRRLGPRPLAQVMGASVIRTAGNTCRRSILASSVSPTRPTFRRSSRKRCQNPYTEPSFPQVRNYKWHREVICELDVLSDAWNLARHRALDRLREEARQVGADAVVGVHLQPSDHDLGKDLIEYIVTGTAVQTPESPGTEVPDR